MSNDEAVIHITPALRDELLRKRAAEITVPDEDPMDAVIKVLGELGRHLIELQNAVARINERMDKVETIADLVQQQVTPVLDEITNGPIGRMLGIKKK